MGEATGAEKQKSAAPTENGICEQPIEAQNGHLVENEEIAESKKYRRHSHSKNGPTRGIGQEQPKVIGNAFSFFRGRPDPNESRYTSDEEQDEEDANMPFMASDSNDEAEIDTRPLTENADGENGENGENVEKERPHAATFSLMRPNFFNREKTDALAKPEAPDDGKPALYPRKIFTMFRKKNREPKKPVLDLAETVTGEDAETSERAQELVQSLLLGSPAINLLASCLCEDEYGIARAPLLLTLLGLKVTDISNSSRQRNRKFRIDLEYGVSPQRLKWSVEKTAKDLLYLHSRFKLLTLRGNIRSEELPKYPVPPQLRRDGRRLKRLGKSRGTSTATRWTMSELQFNNAYPPTSGDLQTQATTGGQTQASGNFTQVSEINDLMPNNGEIEQDRLSVNSGGTFRDRLSSLRAQLSGASSVSSLDSASPEQSRTHFLRNQNYVAEVTNYLTALILVVAMRPQSNRLFHFFEVSPISSLLSYETGYTGKQGVIHVGGTARSQGWRVGHFKANDLKGMIDRRSEKWFLVRNSYVMYVSDINSTVPLEVFLVDSKFKIHYKGHNEPIENGRGSDSDSDYDEEYITKEMVVEETGVKNVLNVFKHLKIVLENAERKLVVIPKSEREQKLWILSLTEMQKNTVWSDEHRFNSFAPVRKDCFAQWFVDGRDYFWAVSSALEMAKDVIFIHDWWLSPELYLRRPANGNQQFRLDRILQRKAQQGVKVFVIVYRNVGTTIPIDSLYTKHSILSLNQENIHVIRSPNQLLQNTYFWAHHEKICVVDYTVAFLGGIDMCYGRWDTPDHVLSDDSNIDFDALDSETLSKDEFAKFRVFPGKDYSNTRVKDFNNLDKPYESLYDRSVVQRMPWHDIHMVTAGEAARDISRHFVQRWNYLLRQKRPSRLTPLLTPPPDTSNDFVEKLGLDGTCEIQIVRSAGDWSLGLKEHEESIHTAYLKLIENSEHLVYIENQFFVTSCFIEGTEILNRVGDALVDRIIRAHKEGTAWKAIILIPLVPGFESLVDKPDGSSVRVVMQCEYMSISRGASSLFAKLRKFGIDPDNYIQFFSLRKWGMLGPDRTLATEVLYIHAKTMIVDDRVAIIGSANINERSMRGSRDSEIAAIVRDSETVSATMNGEKFTVGKFPHTLRLRLMREHLGIAVDILDIVERKFDKYETFAKTPEGLQAATNKFKNKENAEMSAVVELATRDILNDVEGSPRWKNYLKLKNLTGEVTSVPDDIKYADAPKPMPLPLSFNNRTGPHEANKGIRDKKKHSYDARVQHSGAHKQDVYGEGTDKYRSRLGKKARLDSSRFLKDLAHKVMDCNPSGVFLPDIENVREFLTLNDDELLSNMTEENEEILAHRNRERWLLLKKIAYLQRVAAKETKQMQDESVRRAASGLPGNAYDFPGSTPPKTTRNNTPPTNDSYRDNTVVSSVDVPPAEENKVVQEEHEVTPEKEKESEKEPDTGMESIPIVTLDERQTRETIQQINLPGVEGFNKFIDPYGFEDPLDPDFYEDIWYDNARRNTEIFRMIFHSQPDDQVLSWKEYKHFMKMENAFKLSQHQEAKNRREKFRFDTESTETEVDESSEVSRHARRSSQATINFSDLPSEQGIFGEMPLTSNSSVSSKNVSTQRKKFAVQDVIAEHDENGEEKFTDAQDFDLEDKGVAEANGSITSSGTQQGDPEVQPTAPKVDRAHSRKRRAGTFSARRKAHGGERIFERDSAERILQEIHGHLVLFPTDWLMRELEGDNWFYNTDRIPPIEIYD